MSVLLHEGQIGGREGDGTRAREVAAHARPRRHASAEARRPPTRAQIVAGARRAAVPDCAPRRVAPGWPWLAGAALAVGLIVAGLGAFAGGMTARVPERTATVSVGSGQSLWDVAREYAPSADAQAVVDRIRQLNNLGDATVVPGLPLTVPVDSAAAPDREAVAK